MDEPIRVLLVEHRHEDCRIAQQLLTDYDLDFTWRSVASQGELHALADDFGPDIVLCADDSSNSSHSLLGALRLLCSHTPVILISSVREADGSVVCDAAALLRSAPRQGTGEAPSLSVGAAPTVRYARNGARLRRCFASLLESSTDPIVMSDPDGCITYANTEGTKMSEDADDTTQTMQRLTLPAAPTVLIVDDDCLVLSRLRDLVAAEGYCVRTATSGMAALNVLEEIPVSIVITDLNMPGMNGFDLCRRIRERDLPGYVYIVLLTIRDEEQDILAGLDAGADDYLSKRASAAQLTARLRSANRVLALEYSLKNALEKKRQLAMTDSLTGVYNRRYFMRHLSRELKRARRFGGNVALLLLDVDHFKRINDTHGHAAGDRVLRQLTRQITACLKRETDWCARLGGDEFAVVLEGTKAAQARACAEKVRQLIGNNAVGASVSPVRITVSIGVGAVESAAESDSITVQSLLEHADENLYVSKARGGNWVTCSKSNGVDGRARKPVNQGSTHVKSKASVGSVR